MKMKHMVIPHTAGTRVPLFNNGQLDIIPIGVGSMLAKKHFNTSFLIVKGGTHILVDCGRTAPEALAAMGLDLGDISTVLITHKHDDHVGGLGSLATHNRYVGMPFMKKPKLTLIAAKEFAGELWQRSLEGTLSENERAEDGSGLGINDWFTVVDPLKILGEGVTAGPDDRDTYEIDYCGIHIRMMRTMHVPSQAKSWKDSAWSTGLMIDGRVFISGDTRLDMPLINEYVEKAELTFHDVAFFNDPVHAPLSELAKLPDQMKRKIELVHYGDKFAEYGVRDFAGYAVQGATYRFEE